MPTTPVYVDIWDLLKLLTIGLVVQEPGGAICTVEGFDITQSRHVMPVKLKKLYNGEVIDCKLTDIRSVLVPVDTQVPGGRPDRR